MPATMHKASSGKQGIKNTIGNNILLFVSIKSCACSNSFLPTSFIANLSPNLSPTKNNMLEETNITAQEAKKPIFAPNKTTPSKIKASSKTGTKQNIVATNKSIKIKTTKPHFPVPSIKLRIVVKLVKLNALHTKNTIRLITANITITKSSFSHFFILPLYEQGLTFV